MSRTTILLGLVSALSSSGAAGAARGADPAPVAAPTTTVSGIDVVAPAPLKSPPPRAAIDAYVASLGVTALTGQLATWSRTALPPGPSTPMGDAADSLAGHTICPMVMGLPEANADFIVERIRKVGGALGAPVSVKPCPSAANNVVIVFPDDAAAFIRKLADDKPQAFGFRYHGELVQDLLKPVEPIRAWYGVQTVVTERKASRLALSHQSVIFQVLIVVDRDKTDAINMGQLSDYLAMISLAQVDPDKVPPSAPSILNIFVDIANGRAPADGLTRMDAAYLKALYAIGPRQPGEMQNAQIANRLFETLSHR